MRLLAYLKFILDKMTIFLHLNSLLLILKSLQNDQDKEFLKNSNWNMRLTPGQMRMHDMVTTDTMDFEIVGEGAFNDCF